MIVYDLLECEPRNSCILKFYLNEYFDYIYYKSSGTYIQLMVIIKSFLMIGD